MGNKDKKLNKYAIKLSLCIRLPLLTATLGENFS
jgi:hypothetical protein